MGLKALTYRLYSATPTDAVLHVLRWRQHARLNRMSFSSLCVIVGPSAAALAVKGQTFRDVLEADKLLPVAVGQRACSTATRPSLGWSRVDVALSRQSLGRFIVLGRHMVI
jgi:hypothetical protein